MDRMPAAQTWLRMRNADVTRVSLGTRMKPVMKIESRFAVDMAAPVLF